MAIQAKAGFDRKLNDKQWEEWNNMIFDLFWKIWLVIFLVQLFLFIFFEPTEDFSRLAYFNKYIFIPSGVEAFFLISCQVIFTKLFKSHSRRVVSLYTIFLITLFAGITVCVHTSVKILLAMLLLPMMFTPLYKDKLLTFLQAVLLIILFAVSNFYFIPNHNYILPNNPFSPYVELSVFIGGTIATWFILDRVNNTVISNEERSKHDSLTHLYNHENFYEELELYQKDFAKTGKRFSIIVADIDNFKNVNDTYGHAFGDDVIKQVGDIFSKNAKNNGFCARYGGEEFAMILPHAKPEAVAEQIRKDFENYVFNTPDGPKNFTLSVGAAIYDRKYESGSRFFEQADDALYHAKRTGKNKVVISGTYQKLDD